MKPTNFDISCNLQFEIGRKEGRREYLSTTRDLEQDQGIIMCILSLEEPDNSKTEMSGPRSRNQKLVTLGIRTLLLFAFFFFFSYSLSCRLLENQEGSSAANAGPARRLKWRKKFIVMIPRAAVTPTLSAPTSYSQFSYTYICIHSHPHIYTQVSIKFSRASLLALQAVQMWAFYK